jgi:hypothetical protein
VLGVVLLGVPRVVVAKGLNLAVAAEELDLVDGRDGLVVDVRDLGVYTTILLCGIIQAPWSFILSSNIHILVCTATRFNSSISKFSIHK